MVADIPQDIAFSMCHVGCVMIYHMWYAFWPCGMLFDHAMCYDF